MRRGRKRRDALLLIRNTSPDLAIIDITLKGSSGLELIKSIRGLSIGIPVLVLSMHEETLYAKPALRVGATGYITKDQTAEQIIQAVRPVLAGEVYLSERMTASFLKSLTSRGVRSIPRRLDRLTDRELKVLELIAGGHTTPEIAEKLKVGAGTVDTYRARLKAKMDFQNAAELQHFAIRWMQERG